jgi:dTDP-glucose pyrophosphorylase
MASGLVVSNSYSLHICIVSHAKHLNTQVTGEIEITSLHCKLICYRKR